MSDYSIWMLEYAQIPNHHLSSILYGQHNQGTRPITLTILVIKGKGHIALVDIGFNNQGYAHELAEEFGITNWHSPQETLARIGLSPEEVDTVFITHAHFDHMGNLDTFPNAQFYVQKKEILDSNWALSLPEKYNFLKSAINPQDIQTAINLNADGRMSFVNGHRKNVLPGISLAPAYNSHSYGSQMVIIETAGSDGHLEKFVVAGDNCYSYENLYGINHSGVYQPVGFGVGSQVNMIQAIDQMMEITNHDYKHVIVGHEPKSWETFRSWTSEDGMHIAEIHIAEK